MSLDLEAARQELDSNALRFDKTLLDRDNTISDLNKQVGILESRLQERHEQLRESVMTLNVLCEGSIPAIEDSHMLSGKPDTISVSHISGIPNHQESPSWQASSPYRSPNIREHTGTMSGGDFR